MTPPRSLLAREIRLVLLGALLFGCSSQGSDRLRHAEELSRQGRYKEAIEEYRAHMEARLAVANRPEWENPYFYLLLIGDVYLGKGEIERALTSYEDAEKNGVHEALVSDRYRSVAARYEEKGDLKKAFDKLPVNEEEANAVLQTLPKELRDRILRTLTQLED